MPQTLSSRLLLLSENRREKERSGTMFLFPPSQLVHPAVSPAVLFCLAGHDAVGQRKAVPGGLEGGKERRRGVANAS